LVSGALIDRFGKYRSWTSPETISDHLPVSLQVDFHFNRIHYPFKFNKIWLTDNDFKQAVEDYWHDMALADLPSDMDSFVHKLSRLKRFVVKWINLKKAERSKELTMVTTAIAELLDEAHSSPLERDSLIRLHQLSIRKEQLLLQQEITWRLKSRALWLEAGDRNTKYFHAFANQRKNKNSIWSLQIGDG